MGRPRKNLSAPTGYVSKKIHSLENTRDIMTSIDDLWNIIFKRLLKISRAYGFSKVETPFLEDARLYENFFQNNIKEEYWSVETQDRAAILRPTLLPSVLRAYFQHKIFDLEPTSKWWYSGQTVKKGPKGTFCGNHEYGFEIFGTFSHLAEAQLISAVWEFLFSLGLRDLVLEINHIGEEECQRVYQETLGDYLNGKKYELCDSCGEHIKKHPLNVFRCPNLDCQSVLTEAPTVLDYLDQKNHKHFTNILEALDELDIPYQLNPLYSGPEGYSKTNFAIKYKSKTKTVTLGEGGYHDGYMRQLCGKNFCSFGFLGSLQTLYEILLEVKITVAKESGSEVFLVPLGELASKKALRLFRDLVSQKILVYDHFGNLGIKNQLKAAQTYKASIALIMGQKEAVDEMVILRDVKSGMQEIISYDKIIEEVKKRLGK